MLQFWPGGGQTELLLGELRHTVKLTRCRPSLVKGGFPSSRFPFSCGEHNYHSLKSPLLTTSKGREGSIPIASEGNWPSSNVKFVKSKPGS